MTPEVEPMTGLHASRWLIVDKTTKTDGQSTMPSQWTMHGQPSMCSGLAWLVVCTLQACTMGGCRPRRAAEKGGEPGAGPEKAEPQNNRTSINEWIFIRKPVAKNTFRICALKTKAVEQSEVQRRFDRRAKAPSFLLLGRCCPALQASSAAAGSTSAAPPSFHHRQVIGQKSDLRFSPPALPPLPIQTTAAALSTINLKGPPPRCGRRT